MFPFLTPQTHTLTLFFTVDCYRVYVQRFVMCVDEVSRSSVHECHMSARRIFIRSSEIIRYIQNIIKI